jgi:hypothetical protein
MSNTSSRIPAVSHYIATFTHYVNCIIDIHSHPWPYGTISNDSYFTSRPSADKSAAQSHSVKLNSGVSQAFGVLRCAAALIAL